MKLIALFFLLISDIFFLIGKEKDDIESFINEGVYQIERLKEDGWITNIQYEDEVLNTLILFAEMSGLEINNCRCIYFGSSS